MHGHLQGEGNGRATDHALAQMNKERNPRGSLRFEESG